MKKTCESFISELTSNPKTYSPELVSHLAICPQCKQTADLLTNLKSHRTPLTATEISEVNKIVTAATASGVLTSAPWWKSAKALLIVSACVITPLLYTVYLGKGPNSSFAPNNSKPLKTIGEPLPKSDMNTAISSSSLILKTASDTNIATQTIQPSVKLSAPGEEENSWKNK
jgi:hypothetical protein